MLDLYNLELLELSEQLQSRKLSPVEVTESMFRRIREMDARLNSYVCVMEQSALQEAKRAEAELANGDVKGPLHGVPLAVKDIFWTREAPTTAGMAIHAHSSSEHDATVIRKLRDAGAVILGKLVLTEGVYAEHRSPFEAPINPWSEQHWPGASSSGSGVAVAASLCYGALGSETGGSIRLPSAANGVTAIKPTWGRVSRYGVFELAATLDHVGPLARSVADAAAILQVIAGPDPLDPTASQHPVPRYLSALSRDVKGMRIGIDRRWLLSHVDSETTTAVLEALLVLNRLGAQIVEISVPDVTDMVWDWFKVCAVQTAVAHERTYPSKREQYGPALQSLIDMGRELTGMEYQRLLLRRADFQGRFEALFSDVDVIAMPVLPFAVPTLERMAKIDDELIAALHMFTCPFNMSGSPCVVMPCGQTAAGLPLVYQLVGAHFSESNLIGAGYAYQQVTKWHRRHPD